MSWVGNLNPFLSVNPGSDNADALQPAPRAVKPVIIVVDDDSAMNQAVERLLLASNFPTLTFTSAEALLESGQAGNASCLVLDVHLPGISGFELHRGLRRAGMSLPVIFITGHDTPAFRQQVNDAGAVAWFRKPFAGREFLGAVTAAVRQGRDPPPA